MNVRTAADGACCCLVALTASVSDAQTEWTAGTGSWADPDNWTDGVPDSSKNAIIANGGTAQIVADAAAGNLYIGRAGFGTVAHSSGRLDVTDAITLGEGLGDAATYQLSGSALVVAPGILAVGKAGTGNVHQTGGQLGWSLDPEIDGFGGLLLGAEATGIGSYTLAGGTVGLLGGGLVVGQAGTGTMTHTAGVINIWGGTATIGADLNSHGSYELGGGTLFAEGGVIVGDAGTGVLNVTGGDVQLVDPAGAPVILGARPSGHGSCSVSGSGHISLDATLTVGQEGTGELTVLGGCSVSADRGIVLGQEAGSHGSLHISASFAELHGPMIVGLRGVGSVVQDGAMVWISSFGAVIGKETTEQCTYTLNGGCFSPDGGLVLGEQPGSDGLLTMTGGQLGEPFALQGTLAVGQAGTGSIVQNDGSVFVEDIVIAQSVSGVGAYHLRNGTLTAVTLRTGAGSGVFEWTGGTLHAQTVAFSLANQGGVLSPEADQAIGTTLIQGDYLQDAAAALEIEIGGSVRGDEYDAVDVTGAAAMEGLIDVSLIHGFLPVPGDSFDILIAGLGITVGPAGLEITGDGMFSWRMVNAGTGLQLEYVPEPAMLSLLALAGLALVRRRRR